MALVHSRIRRVFFAVPRDDYGALGGRWAVHQQKSLNHHYEVSFVIFASNLLQPSCLAHVCSCAAACDPGNVTAELFFCSRSQVYKGLLRRQCEHEIACLAT